MIYEILNLHSIKGVLLYMFFYNLETERLFLHNIDTSHREFIFNHFSDDIVNKYLFDAEPLKDIYEADEIIKFYTISEPRLQHRWVIRRKSDNINIGTCGFHCWDTQNSKVDVGYDLRKEFWGNGYMEECMKELIKFARYKMQVKEINACIYLENEKSIRLVKNLGFSISGSSVELFRGKEYLHNIYALFL